MHILKAWRARCSSPWLRRSIARLAEAGHLDAQHRRIQEAVVFIEANFASRMTREEVARVAGLSPFHFSRLFHALVGLTPHQYLLRCRLRNAQELLSRSEERSIADICCGDRLCRPGPFCATFSQRFRQKPAGISAGAQTDKTKSTDVLGGLARWGPSFDANLSPSMKTHSFPWKTLLVGLIAFAVLVGLATHAQAQQNPVEQKSRRDPSLR